MRYNLYRSAQINAAAAAGLQLRPGDEGHGGGFRADHAREMGFDYIGMSFQEKKAQEGVPAGGDLRLLAAVRLPHPCGAV